MSVPGVERDSQPEAHSSTGACGNSSGGRISGPRRHASALAGDKEGVSCPLQRIKSAPNTSLTTAATPNIQHRYSSAPEDACHERAKSMVAVPEYSGDRQVRRTTAVVMKLPTEEDFRRLDALLAKREADFTAADCEELQRLAPLLVDPEYQEYRWAHIDAPSAERHTEH
jgi:hypothetical protein